MNYYLVTAKCGHVGKRNYIDVEFPVCAENGSEAAQMVLKRNKVKRHLKNAITSVSRITEEQYKSYVKEDKYKNYLSSHYSREYYPVDLNVKRLEGKHRKIKKEFNNRNERISFIFKKYEMFHDIHIRSKEKARLNFYKEEII